MAKWLLENKIVEQIFGPNLHIEVGNFFFHIFDLYSVIII